MVAIGRNGSWMTWFGAVLLAALVVLLAPVSVQAEDPTANQAQQAAEAATRPDEAQSEAAQSVQGDVEKATEKETAKKQKELVDEAISAVRLTREALGQLEENKVDEALKSLVQAVGTLELLVARAPELSLVPVAVDTTVYDVIAEVDTVRKAVKEAREALKEGKVQVARHILKDLASEIVISTTNLPLATYPDAIKDAVPMIDAGKIDEAKAQLELALNLLVVEDKILPLPAMRARALLREAETLAENAQRTAEQNQRLRELITEVRKQIALGSTLGYFDEQTVDSMYDELSSIEKKTGQGKSGSGFFDRIKSLFGG